MKTVTLNELQNNLSKYLEASEGEDILIIKEGKPVGVLRGFSDDDDRFDCELENHPVFKERVKRSRALFREGKGISIEEVEANL